MNLPNQDIAPKKELRIDSKAGTFRTNFADNFSFSFSKRGVKRDTF